MTLDEIKREVCVRLLDGFHIVHDVVYRAKLYFPQEGIEVDWDIEGLQICHEAEKLMTVEQVGLYFDELNRLTALTGKTLLDKICFHATHEQRLQALARVWWPERVK